MIRLSSTIALLLLASGAMLAAAAEFATIDDASYSPNHPREEAVERELALAKRPAALDPEGNWGYVSEGFQLSLRFTKNTYISGEPIYAILLQRNVTDQVLKFDHSYVLEIFRFAVSKDRAAIPLTQLGLQKEPSFPFKISAKTSLRELPTLHQIKYTTSVDALYEMKAPGEYVIYVTRKVPKLDGSGKTELRSGNAIIRVAAGQEQASVQTSGSASATSKVADTPARLPSGSKQVSSRTAPPASKAQPKSSANNPPGVPAPSTDSNHSAPPVMASAVPAANATTQPQTLLFAAITAALLAFIALILWRARRRAQPGK